MFFCAPYRALFHFEAVPQTTIMGSKQIYTLHSAYSNCITEVNLELSIKSCVWGIG